MKKGFFSSNISMLLFCAVVSITSPLASFASELVEGGVDAAVGKLSEESAAWILSRSVNIPFKHAEELVSSMTKGWATGQNGLKYALAAKIAISTYNQCKANIGSQEGCVKSLEMTIQMGKILEPDAASVFDDLNKILDWGKICVPLAADAELLEDGGDHTAEALDAYLSKKKKIWEELQCEHKSNEVPRTVARIYSWLARNFYWKLFGMFLAAGIVLVFQKMNRHY